MEQLPQTSRGCEKLDEEGLAALRARLRELGADLSGTLAKLPPEVKQQYREYELSVVESRLDSPADHTGGSMPRSFIY